MAITSARMLQFNHQFERLYAAQFAPLLSQTGLGMQEVHVLLFLANNPGMDTARDVTEYRGLAKSQVSQAVEQLTARGLVSRTPDGEDRRIIHLSVTESGGPLAREAQRLQARCSELVLAGLNKRERENFAVILEKVFAKTDTLMEKENNTL
ncbi:MAG: MarR family transcriptional regulator [Oscillibacter sp.]